MASYNGMTYEGKETMLRVVRQEADGFFALAERPDTWEGSTACADWEVRDIVGHLVDTTESYFEAFDAARSGSEVEPAYGLPGMAERAGERGRSFRDVPQQQLIDRLRTDFAKMMEIFEGLTEDDWTGLMVPHFYMGPVPSFFYPAFQLMDYGVHSWDMREGARGAHVLDGEAADLLIPFMFGIWQGTASSTSDPGEVGVRITNGPNAGDTVFRFGPEGLSFEAGDVSGLPAVLEFDSASLVLTAFGRVNAGTLRGDRAVAERFLSLFFRI